jgi:two-component system, LytTR family, sensor kinase
MILWLVLVVRLLLSSAFSGTAIVGALVATLPPVLYWAALTPAILLLSSYLPLRRGSLVRSIVLLAVGGAGAAALYAELMVWIFSGLLSGVRSQFGPLTDWGIRFQFGLFSYSFLLSWGYVHEYFTRLRARDVALARLETELAQAQLRALKSQLQPHFLFNTLHAVTVLIRHDANAAIETVMRLSDLLRMTLTDAEQAELPLERELRFVRLYLELEQTRFRDRLEVVWDVAPGLTNAAVPPLLLQPLVENAIKHGIGARGCAGRVLIGASADNGTLTLRVTDNGPGLRAAGGDGNGAGIGLASTRGRLEKLFGTAHHFSIEDVPGGGAGVTVQIPYRTLGPTAPHDA